MWNKGPRLGSVLVLFTVTVLCVVVLATLSLETARADLAVANRAAETTQQVYEIEKLGQEWLAQAYAALPNAETTESLPVWKNGKAKTQLKTDSRLLDITLCMQQDGTVQIEQWENYPRWQQDTVMEDLWDGTVQKGE